MFEDSRVYTRDALFALVDGMLQLVRHPNAVLMLSAAGDMGQ